MILGVGYFMLSTKSTQATSTTTQVSGKAYSLAMVAQHKNAASCWTAIDGKVYDLTNWIPQHPGGAQNILAICGIDATQAYQAQHGGQRRPANELTSFYIGDLAT